MPGKRARGTRGSIRLLPGVLGMEVLIFRQDRSVQVGDVVSARDGWR